jgi:hypothetical protein
MVAARQLSLFKGKRQRGQAPPAALEFASCCVLADICDRWLMPGWRYTHLPFGEERDHRVNPKTGKRYSLTGQRLARMGTKKGWPDYLFIGPARAVFFLEMKRPRTGRASDEQDLIAEHLGNCDIDYFRTNDVGEAIEQLKRRGIVRAQVTL